MMAVKVIYIIIAAMIFLSGLFILLRIHAVEKKFKRLYFILFIPLIAALSLAWPIGILGGLFGLILGVADSIEGE